MLRDDAAAYYDDYAFAMPLLLLPCRHSCRAEAVVCSAMQFAFAAHRLFCRRDATRALIRHWRRVFAARGCDFFTDDAFESAVFFFTLLPRSRLSCPARDAPDVAFHHDTAAFDAALSAR